MNDPVQRVHDLIARELPRRQSNRVLHAHPSPTLWLERDVPRGRDPPRPAAIGVRASAATPRLRRHALLPPHDAHLPAPGDFSKYIERMPYKICASSLSRKARRYCLALAPTGRHSGSGEDVEGEHAVVPLPLAGLLL